MKLVILKDRRLALLGHRLPWGWGGGAAIDKEGSSTIVHA